MATQEDYIDRIINDFPDNSKLRVKPFRAFFVDLVKLIYNLPGSSVGDYEEFRRLVFGVLGDPRLQEKLNSPSILDFIMQGIKVVYNVLPNDTSIKDYITGIGTVGDFDNYFTVKPGELHIFRYKVKVNGSSTFNAEDIYIFKGGVGNFGIKALDSDMDIQKVYESDFFKLDRELYITERLQPIIMGNNTFDQYAESMDNMGFESILDALENLKEGSGAGKFTKSWVVQQPNNPNQANGLQVNVGDAIEDFLIAIFRKASPPNYVLPTASLSTVPANSQFEVGTTLNLSLTGTFNQNDGGTYTARRIYKNGSLFVSGESATDTITLTLGTSISYSFQVDYNKGPIKNNSLGVPDPTNQILAGTTSSGNVTFSPLLKNFYGAAAGDLTNYRNLPLSNFGDNYFVIQTGTTLQDFYIVIPSNKKLDKVWDANISANITSVFGSAINIQLADAGGTLQNYKLYKFHADTPYSVSHDYQINIS